MVSIMGSNSSIPWKTRASIAGNSVAEWQREDGKRKQCEAASLKSVKKIKCEFDECEVFDLHD